MNLELIIAPSGYGKTEYILDHVEKNRKNKKIIILTPDQNSYNFEESLCKKFSATFNIDVMNFSSFSRLLEKKLIINKENIFPDYLKIYFYLEVSKKLAKNNNFLALRVLQDNNFLTVISDILGELNDYNVTVEKLDEYLKNNNTVSNFNKIKHIKEFYQEYINILLEYKKEDSNNYINRLIENIDYIDLEDYIFYIDGYYNFTQQEFKFLESILKKSNKVVFSVISDINRYTNYNFNYEEQKNLEFKLPSINDLNNEYKYSLDIFRKSHEILANLSNILLKNNIQNYDVVAILSNGLKYETFRLNIAKSKICKVEEICSSNNIRYENEELSHLAKEYPKILKSKFLNDDYNNKNIKIIELATPEQEIKQVAREIYRLLNGMDESNYLINQNDIAILYRDENYEKYLNIFIDYGIKIHLDKDIDVSNHRLFKLVNNILTYSDDNFYNCIENILKSRLVNITKIMFELKNLSNFNENIGLMDLLSILKENQIKTYNDFKKRILLDKNKSKYILDVHLVKNFFEFIREKLLNIQKKKNIRTFTKALDSVLVYFDVKMSLDKKIEEYDEIEELQNDSVDRQIYSKFLSVLDNLIVIMGDQNISYLEYKNLLLLAIKNINYRSIPEVNNYVNMSLLDLSKVENKKIVFLIGFNNGVLPKKITNNSIIDDNDKTIFSINDIHLSPKTSSLLIDEEFVSYIALTRSRQKIIITYNVDKDNSISPYYNTIKDLFNKIKISKADTVLNIDVNFVKTITSHSSEDSFFELLLKNIYCKRELNYVVNKFIQIYSTLINENFKQKENLDKIISLLLSLQKNADHNYNFKDNNVYDYLDDKNKIDNSINNYKYYIQESNFNFENIDNDLKEKIKNKREEVFMNFSASKLENYQKNAYGYFIKYVLNIKEPESYGINPLNKGSFYHSIFEHNEVTEFIEKESLKIDLNINKDMTQVDKKLFIEKQVDIENIKHFLIDIIKNSSKKDILEYMKLIEVNDTNKYIFKKDIDRLAASIRVEIIYTAWSNYKVFEKEKKFKLVIEGNKVSCSYNNQLFESVLERKYEIKKIIFTGIIDRIDKNGKNYLIIDYKTSKRDFSYVDFYNGKISQLLCYLFALEMIYNINETDVFGIYYREIAKLSNPISDFRLRGLTNEDVILTEDTPQNLNQITFSRITSKNKVHSQDIYKVYNSIELEKLKNKNLEYIFETIEKIQKFDFFIGEEELLTMYKYAAKQDLKLEENIEVIKGNEFKKIIIEKDRD